MARPPTDAEMANINQQLSVMSARIGAREDAAAAKREAMAKVLYGADTFLCGPHWADLSEKTKEPYYWKAEAVLEDLRRRRIFPEALAQGGRSPKGQDANGGLTRSAITRCRNAACAHPTPPYIPPSPIRGGA